MRFTIEGVRDIVDLVRQLSIGLYKLSFKDNFESFTVEGVQIPSNTEISIQNKLTFVPKHYIITTQTGNSLVTKGDKEWTKTALYFKNNGSNDVTLNIVFLR